MSEGHKIQFDGWMLHKDVGELARNGRRIRLQDQPFQVLDELLAHPGELVTREQLIARLWPKVVVDFDTGLNSAVRKLRIALGDVAETPRYIETVPRRGYRFIGTIDPPIMESASTVPAAQRAAVSSPVPPAPEPVEPPHDDFEGRAPPVNAPRLRAYAAVAIAAIAVVLLIALARVFDLRREPSATAEYEGGGAPGANLAARTLAVLPFHASATDDAGILLAQSVTDLVRNRLAALEDLTVVGISSTSGLTDSQANLRAIGEKLHAQVLLKGVAGRDGDRLHLDVQLVDAQSGEQLWSAAFDRPLTEVATIREEIFGQVAGVLRVPVDQSASTAPAGSSISLDAYQLYVRGQQLLARSTVADAESAVELFQRATILDPGFARAYLGLGQALEASGDKTLPDARSGGWVMTRPRTDEVDAQAAKAFDRALELNPALGEAWIERARLPADPVDAEKLYRKGLELAPNYAAGYAHYANFLFRESRAGEAIETITRASQIDPLTPELYQTHAFFLMVTRSDVAGHDRLVREALAINPRLPRALRQLAQSRWEFSGEFADAAQLIERAIAVDPRWTPGRTLAREIYLDLGDRAAAVAVLGDSLPPDVRMEVAQYDGDRKRAAALLADLDLESSRDTSGSHSPVAEAIRDGAIATGEFGPAVRLLGSVHAAREKLPAMWSRGFSLVYAHTLVLAGEVERGRRLAESTLALVDTHGVGRAENWFSRERAAAFAVLRDDGRALDELENSVRTGKLYRWWYLAGHDPLYEHLWGHPRFKALDAQARQHIDRQRALLEELRRSDAVPRRAD
jgi:DNA-binding winged helix-turn-helix (wHTH) protein/TolB-like protein/Tfp pilus assembly protein PilF